MGGASADSCHDALPLLRQHLKGFLLICESPARQFVCEKISPHRGDLRFQYGALAGQFIASSLDFLRSHQFHSFLGRLLVHPCRASQNAGRSDINII